MKLISLGYIRHNAEITSSISKSTLIKEIGIACKMRRSRTMVNSTSLKDAFSLSTPAFVN
jgi:hypothetical protein